MHVRRLRKLFHVVGGETKGGLTQELVDVATALRGAKEKDKGRVVVLDREAQGADDVAADPHGQDQRFSDRPLS